MLFIRDYPIQILLALCIIIPNALWDIFMPLSYVVVGIVGLLLGYHLGHRLNATFVRNYARNVHEEIKGSHTRFFTIPFLNDEDLTKELPPPPDLVDVSDAPSQRDILLLIEPIKHQVVGEYGIVLNYRKVSILVVPIHIPPVMTTNEATRYYRLLDLNYKTLKITSVD